jgi:hypothetical protein
MRRFVSLFLLMSMLLSGSGCVLPQEERGNGPLLPTVSQNIWVEFGPGIERLVYQSATSTVPTMMLYRFAPNDFSWSLVVKPAPQRIAAWAESDPSAVVLVNGVYFHEDFSPSGWMKQHGSVIGTREFDWERSAAVTLNPVFSIGTASSSADLRDAQDAFQTYPFLIRHGLPAVQEDSGLIARRTFMGLDTDGRVYVGIVPGGLLSLYALSQALGALSIAWQDVVNLDGGPSSGLSVQGAERTDVWNSDASVPNVIVGRRAFAQ